MRALLALVLIPLCLAPGAAAQDVTEMTLVVDAFEDPIAPLKEDVERTFTLDAPCAFVVPARQELLASFEVVESPAWSTIVLDPPTATVPVSSCEGGRIRVAGTIVARVDDTAPALAPTPVRLRATVAAPDGPRTADGETSIQAAFFGIVDVLVDETLLRFQDADERTATVTVSNHGNAPVRVAAAVAKAPGDVTVLVPDPFVVGVGERHEAQVVVRWAEGTGPRTIEIAFTSAHAEDATLAGDAKTISLLASRRGFLESPGAPLAAVVVALAALAWARRTA